MAECEHAELVGTLGSIKTVALLNFLTHLLGEMACQGFQLSPLADAMAEGHAMFPSPDSTQDAAEQEHFRMLLEEWGRYTKMVEDLATVQATGR